MTDKKRNEIFWWAVRNWKSLCKRASHWPWKQNCIPISAQLNEHFGCYTEGIALDVAIYMNTIGRS